MKQLDVKGIVALYTNLAKEEGLIPTKSPMQVARLIFTRAKKYCPVDSGTLKASGRVLGGITTTHYGAGAQVIFATPYAYIVHENRTARHDKGKISKFLETAAIEVGLEYGYALTMEIQTDRIVLFVNAPTKGSPISRNSADIQQLALTLTMGQQGAWDELDALMGL